MKILVNYALITLTVFIIICIGACTIGYFTYRKRRNTIKNFAEELSKSN